MFCSLIYMQPNEYAISNRPPKKINFVNFSDPP